MPRKRKSHRHFGRVVFTELLESRRLLAYTAPVAWGTFVGGSQSEFARGVAADGTNSIIVGETTSTNAPLANNSFHGATFDAFVAKVDGNGKLIWFTYLGGGGDDHAFDVSIDGSGNAYVSGYTSSNNLASAKNSFHGGTFDDFVAKIDTNGNLQWTNYVGGSDDEFSWSGIDVDAAGNSVIAGVTLSTNLTGAGNSTHGGSDAFAAKLDANGNQTWATYLGGTDSDGATSVSLDSNGNALLTGQTNSSDFQTSLNSKVANGGSDMFVAKVNSAGAVQWSRYVGGDGYDFGYGIAVDGSNNALFTGLSQSTSITGAANFNHGGTGDALVGKINTNGAIVWLNFVGGSAQDSGQSIAVDAAGNAYVTGQSLSTNFEGMTNPTDQGNGFLAQLNSSGQIQTARYFGKSTVNTAADVTIDVGGNVLVAGQTNGILDGAINTSAGSSDAFVTKVAAVSATGSIGGIVFNDVNSNGIRDAAEAIIPNWQVYLDYNNNNILDANEQISVTTTDSFGDYIFTNLADGNNYHVKQVFQNGFRKTLPGSGVQGYDAIVAGGTAVEQNNFGMTTNILLAGVVYNDANSNGVQDGGENALANVTVNIISNGLIIATRTTDATGKWRVQGLAAGSGSAEVVLPPGMVATTPANGKYIGSATAGQQLGNLNFGLKTAAPVPAPAPAVLLNLFAKNDSIDDASDFSLAELV